MADCVINKDHCHEWLASSLGGALSFVCAVSDSIAESSLSSRQLSGETMSSFASSASAAFSKLDNENEDKVLATPVMAELAAAMPLAIVALALSERPFSLSFGLFQVDHQVETALFAEVTAPETAFPVLVAV